MNTPPDAQPTVPAQPPLDLDLLAGALGHSARWKILKELSTGEPRMVVELAEQIGCSPGMTSKHLAILRTAGLVVQGRAQLYQIQKHHLPAPGEPIVDFGHCLLRLDRVG